MTIARGTSARSGDKQPRTCPSRQAGYTVVEIAVMLVIIGVVLAMGTPGITRLVRGNAVENATDQVAGHFRLARHKAVATGVQHIVLWDESAGTYNIVRDDDNDGSADAGEPTEGPYLMPQDVTLVNQGPDKFSVDQVIFQPGGGASESGTLRFVNDRGVTRSVVLLAPTANVRTE